MKYIYTVNKEKKTKAELKDRMGVRQLVLSWTIMQDIKKISYFLHDGCGVWVMSRLDTGQYWISGTSLLMNRFQILM